MTEHISTRRFFLNRWLTAWIPREQRTSCGVTGLPQTRAPQTCQTLPLWAFRGLPSF